MSHIQCILLVLLVMFIVTFGILFIQGICDTINSKHPAFNGRIPVNPHPIKPPANIPPPRKSINPRPRWQIFIGYGDDGQVRYYFEDTDPDFLRKVAPGVQYGRAMLYKGRNFVYKLKGHDAIEYCIGLNAQDKAKP